MSYEIFADFPEFKLRSLEQIYSRLVAVNISKRDEILSQAKPIPLSLLREITNYTEITSIIREILESQCEKERV